MVASPAASADRSAALTVSYPRPECSMSNVTRSQPAALRMCPMAGVMNSFTQKPVLTPPLSSRDRTVGCIMESPSFDNRAILQHPIHCPERSEVLKRAALEHHQISLQPRLHEADFMIEPQRLGTRARCRRDNLKRRHSQRLQIRQLAVKHDAAELHVRSCQKLPPKTSEPLHPFHSHVVGATPPIQVLGGPASLQPPSEISERLPLTLAEEA